MEKAKFFRAGAEVSEEEFFRSGKEQKMLRQKKLVAMYGELMDGVYNKFVQERCGCGSIEITILYGTQVSRIRMRVGVDVGCPHGHTCRTKVMSPLS